MKHMLFLAALFPVSAFASVPAPKQYRVELKVFMNGKLVSSPRVVVKNGQKAELADMNEKTGNGHFVEVVAHSLRESTDQALLQLVIGKIEHGKRTVVGTPQISTLLKEESTMEIEENGKQVFKVAATVSPELPSAQNERPRKK